MSFYTIKNPAERNRIIHEYLAVKNRIKKRSMIEREGDLQREGELEETFNPIIQSNEKAATAIQKSIEPLSEQMVEMNKKLEKNNIKSSTTGSVDRYFGIVKDNDNEFMMGRKKVEFVNESTIKVEETLYELTKGLWSLINDNKPKEYTDKDLETYTRLVKQTDVINYPQNTDDNSRPRSTKKYRTILRSMEEKQPRKRVRNSISGSGMNFLPSDINSLKEKLQLLLGEYAAGNKTTRNQIVAILDNLRGRKKISEKQYNHVNRLLQ